MARFTKKAKNCLLTVKVTLSFGEVLNERHLEYISEKNIYGLMKMESKKKNRVIFSGPVGITLYDRLEKTVSKFDFFFILEQIVDITRHINSNSMMIGNVIWDIHHVYINEVTKELQFIYLPLEKKKKEYSLSEFLDQVIYSSIPDESSDKDYISRFVYYLRSLPKYDPGRIEDYISREERAAVTLLKNHGQRMDPISNQGWGDDEATGLLGVDDEATGLLYSDGDNTGLLQEDDDATGLLIEDESKPINASMTRISTGEMFTVNKAVFRIGKENKTSDFTVVNNPKISRNHAEIIRRNNIFYIVDSESRNGTFVNGIQIKPRQETEIRDGDMIRLADEDFKFFL